MVHLRTFITALLTTGLLSCVAAQRSTIVAKPVGIYKPPASSEFVGGVYAMSNNVDENTLVVYARRRDGTLQLLDPALKTGGKGAVLNFGMGSDPLFSSFSVVITSDYRFVMAVNAGSSSVSVFRVQPDFSLRLVHVQPVPGLGPNSIAVSGNLVYVASPDADGTFDAIPAQEGALTGFYLTPSGKLIPIPGGRRVLTFRPSAIKFSPDRRSLVVSNVFSSVNALATGDLNEIVVFRVNSRGLLSFKPVSGATSTELNNAEGRNLPSAIGFEIVKSEGVQYVVVPEVRSLVGADGMDPADQAASVSTWRLDVKGRLFPVQLDVPVGSSITSGQDDSCWIEFSADLRNFWVSNTPSNSISAFSFKRGISSLEEEVAATGTSPVDLWRSRDGRFLYQLFGGSVGAFEVSADGGLTQIQNPMNVPELNPQGIVAF
ncbi:WD40/YVTN repeat-like containing protein [Gracilaria domingensis]|nr:WD40/YVTN repeat-like containing protein [Gracilaria domingensis]